MLTLFPLSMFPVAVRRRERWVVQLLVRTYHSNERTSGVEAVDQQQQATALPCTRRSVAWRWRAIAAFNLLTAAQQQLIDCTDCAYCPSQHKQTAMAAETGISLVNKQSCSPFPSSVTSYCTVRWVTISLNHHLLPTQQSPQRRRRFA